MSFKLTIEDKELRKLEASLKKAGLFMSSKAMDEAEAIAEDIMKESRAEVPSKTGTLQEATFVIRDNDTVSFGYGGPADIRNPETGRLASEYMLPVHEILDAEHDNGKAKFFEDPLNRALPKIPTRFIDAVSRALGAFKGGK